MSSFFQTSIEFLSGVGPSKAVLLRQELQISTFDDLLYYFPFRYEDRTQLHTVATLRKGLPYVQLKGTICAIKLVETGKKRLTADLRDQTGAIKLLWFRGMRWINKQLQPGALYIVFGKLNFYRGQMCLIHPELTMATYQLKSIPPILPIYHTTEKLRLHHLDSRGIAKLQRSLLQQLPISIMERLPEALRQRYQMIGKRVALLNIHFPNSHKHLQQARFHLKFEELFYIQLRLLQLRYIRMRKHDSKIFDDLNLLRQFYYENIPFQLTHAQKRVVREIHRDLKSGYQMSRLLQGDVGSGKTIVALLSMLIVVNSGGQVAMMAPTEILAEQHYQGLRRLIASMNIRIAMLTGSTKLSERKELLDALAQGDIQILVGTHALLSDTVTFKNLGLVVIDEQHRFGVAQRAKLSQKNQSYMPHILIMTATPIPRTLALTLYGDLDVSVIDTMPPGRQPIKTSHYYDAQRLKVFHFMSKQIAQGGQVYIIYPLIEESEQLGYKNLLDGYESICRAFPATPISMIHSKMKATDKDYEMQRFVKGETKIMVSTTVIEVGIDVPNATVMVIENAEYFGLAQLHQLRGRVGRGSQQAYCILMTDYKLNEKSSMRIDTMVHTNDGFKIADVDLQLRGPGDLTGVQQSGVLELKIADLSQDGQILKIAREAAKEIIYQDPTLAQPEHADMKAQLDTTYVHTHTWSNTG